MPFDLVRRKFPAGNFLDFLFLQAGGGPRGSNKPRRESSRRGLKPRFLVLPRNLRAVFFPHLMTISSAKGQGKRGLSCIRILSDKARHEVINITEQGGIARRHGGSVSRWKSYALPDCKRVAHVDAELK